MRIDNLPDREEESTSKPQGGKLRKSTLLIVVLIGLMGLSAPDARAAFSDDFDSLLTDLQQLEASLSGSTDKTSKNQYKVVVKAIAAIEKPSPSLATDLKTATKIAVSLQKTFPDDTTLADLMSGVFAGIESDATGDLDELESEADALPTGAAQTKALAAAAKAQTALNIAGAAPDQKTLVAALGSALKSITGGDKDLNIKGGGGGGGHSSSSGKGSFKANIDGKNFTAKILSVTNALNNSEVLVLSGATSVIHSASNYDFQQLSIGFISFDGTGAYNADDTPQTEIEFYYFHDTATIDEQWDTYIGGGNGTVTVTSFDSTAGTVAGNFDITVVNDDDPSQSMEITGTFSLKGDMLKGF